MPEATQEQVLGWVADAIRAQNAVGITGIHQMDGGQETADAFAALEAAGLLNLRVRFHQWVDPSDSPEALAEIIRRRDLTGSTWTANSVKFMVDGVIDTGTAWLEEPDTRGDGNDPMWPDTEHFRRTIKQFHDAGFHIATHAIGDRAIREVLDAYVAAGGSAGRHRIEHIETAGPELVARFRREGVSASMQPIHLRWLQPDLSDPWSERLGIHRCAHTMPSGDMQRRPEPTSCSGRTGRSRRTTRASASSRRSAATPPTSTDHRPLGTSRALTGLETLTGYTANAARVDGGAGGVLAVGAPADLVAWGDDIVEVAPEDVTDLPGPPHRGGRPHGALPRLGARRVVRGSAHVTATILDGKATAAAIKAELAERVARLRRARRHPGPRHGPRRRRPRQPLLRRRQAPRLRRGRHHLAPRRPARPTRRRRRSTTRSPSSTPTRRAPATSSSCRCPKGLDESRALEPIDPDKDADGLHPTNLGRLVLGIAAPLPCTPRGIVELLRRYDVPIAGAEVTVVGRGVTVGRPLGLLLTRKSENATVTLCHTGTRDLAAHTRGADIVVAAAGVAAPHHRRHGQAGRRGARRRHHPHRRRPRGRRRTPTSARSPAFLAPMPGGIGPMTRAMLLANVVESAERAAGLA